MVVVLHTCKSQFFGVPSKKAAGSIFTVFGITGQVSNPQPTGLRADTLSLGHSTGEESQKLFGANTR